MAEKWYQATGRRKTAVARVRLTKGKGGFLVNDKPVVTSLFTEILKITSTEGKFDITAKVTGSGQTGQMGAVALGLARALCLVDPKLRTVLRKKGFMTRDPRMKERKKPGLPGARKKKSSPKR